MEVNQNHCVGFHEVEALIVDAETAEVIEKFEEATLLNRRARTSLSPLTTLKFGIVG